MKDISKNLSKLNTEQRKAVDTIEGPVLVVAGPGTGKTQVLALRIANILQKTDVNASNILCLTFTESGVVAMRKRLLELIGNEAYYVRIHTFHSFCNEIIQTFPEEFVFAKELAQLDDLNKLKILRESIDLVEAEVGKSEFILIPFNDKYYYLKDIISSIQTLKREGIGYEELEKKSSEKIKEMEENPDISKRTGKPTDKWHRELKTAKKNFELSRIFKQYAALLLERGFYDYEDMILFVLEKFKTKEEILSFYQEKYLYVLVDEYQDTNGAQNEILKYLGNFDESPNIFAVGDDDQAIYRFQGANVENLLFFEKQFKNVQTIPIAKNYRSSQIILDIASSVIENNQARLVNYIPYLEKKLKAEQNIPNRKAQVYEFDHSDSEISFLVSEIKKLKEQGVNLNDIAVIYRNHSDSVDLIEALVKQQIPLQIAAGKNALETKSVEKLINLLKVVQYTEKDREFYLFKVLFYEFFNFNRLDVFNITRLAGDERISIFDLLTKEELKEKLESLKLKDQEKLTKFALDITQWKADSVNLSLIQFVEKISKESGYIDWIFKQEYSDVENINSINSFFSYAKTLNRINTKLSLEEFLNDLVMIEEEKIPVEEKELDINKNGVNLMTAHKSKGLEFKYVFITQFYDKKWGGQADRDKIKVLLNSDLQDKVDALEDERRLFFVALTRAKEYLYITYAKKYPSGNSTKEVSPSQFLNEIDPSLIEKVDTAKYEEINIEEVKSNVLPALISSYTPSEKEFLNSLVEKFRISASALNEYIECPLKFKFNRLLKVPKAKDKTFAMGTSIHFALEHFYRHLMKGELNDQNFLKFLFEQQLQRELLGPEEYESTLAEGKKIIEDYYEFYKGTFVKPIDVEYGFYGRNVMLESTGIEAIPLAGKIDRIEPFGNESNHIKIVDYKTSKPKSENEVRGNTKNSDGAIFRQLAFYKLLAQCDSHFKLNPASAKFIVDEVEVDFLKPDEKGRFKRISLSVTDSEVDELKEKVIDVMTRIRNLEFSGTPEYPLCGECEYCTI